jgi:hypothetical protein
MSIQEYHSGPTSNDLLESRVAENALAAPEDPAGARSVDDGPNIENARDVNTET